MLFKRVVLCTLPNCFSFQRNIIRVLNLWQKNNVFTSQVIQPLLDMADPNHPLHQEIQMQNSTANGKALSPGSYDEST